MRALRWLHLLLLAAGSAFLLAAAVFLAIYLVDRFDGDDGGPGFSDAGTVTGFDLRLQRPPATATAKPSPTAEATPLPVGEVPGRLVIPRIGVDAPIVTIGVDGDGVMESPSTPTDVGWYDFTARPGSAGNAVFSAHVDYRNYGPAVFWDLRKLEPNDIVEVDGQDGSVYQYEVVSSIAYPADQAPVSEIVGPTERETVTLITCDGTFNSEVRQYSHRLVVQAERIGGGEPGVRQ